MSHAPAILPEFYYHDHFCEMIDFILSTYTDFLDPAEHEVISKFRALSFSAQCVYIRMMNRKRAVFNLSDFDYPEIDAINDACEELRNAAFLRLIAEEDYAALVMLSPKDELLEIAQLHELAVKPSWSKSRLADFIVTNLEFDEFVSSLDCAGQSVPNHRETISYLAYLYFGRLSTNLTSFALRDLGLVKARDEGLYKARFDSKDEAKTAYFYTKSLEYLKKSAASGIENFCLDLTSMPAAQSDFTQILRNQVLFRCGQYLEKKKRLSDALEAYRLATCFECRERCVRILFTQGNTDAAKQLLDEMISDPISDEEYIFATDFYNRKFGVQKIGIFTELLRSSPEIEIDDLYRTFPEAGAIAYFERQGWTAHHVENGLWPALFALIFWDELFETKGAYASSFDRLPPVLATDKFAVKFSIEIDYKLRRLTEGSGLPAILASIQDHFGKENGIFSWSDDLAFLLTDLVTKAPPFAVAGIVRRLAYDFKSCQDGFPDLMLVNDSQVKFIEVKAEGDQIRRNQLARLNLLRQSGFQAELCRVKYIVDPQQTYVVVDIETTGRSAPYGRITEVAAIKVCNGEIIDTWHSLINPECRIPKFITELTGIDQAMVADAPLFRGIADELENFIDGSVFVAHNVQFDHSFLASEYARLEKYFRHPKLCTCAGMRRYYPGLSSYGLANLSREYAIPLKNHHRALADATATVELLNLINAKRCTPLAQAKHSARI